MTYNIRVRKTVTEKLVFSVHLPIHL